MTEAELQEAYAYEYDFDSGEEVVLFNVQISRKEALEGPHRIQWMEASTQEKLALEAKCWRGVQDGELMRGDEVIPT